MNLLVKDQVIQIHIGADADTNAAIVQFQGVAKMENKKIAASELFRRMIAGKRFSEIIKEERQKNLSINYSNE